jgi:hypothetical protein
MALKREDQFLIVAAVAGVNLPQPYSWAEMDDGFVEAQDTKTYPGGMINQVNLGGPATRGDITVQTQYSTALAPYMVQLEQACGRAAAYASYRPLDANGNPDGPVVNMSGILKSVQLTGRNANNTGAAFLKLVIGADTQASIGT